VVQHSYVINKTSTTVKKTTGTLSGVSLKFVSWVDVSCCRYSLFVSILVCRVDENWGHLCCNDKSQNTANLLHHQQSNRLMFFVLHNNLYISNSYLHSQWVQLF